MIVIPIMRFFVWTNVANILVVTIAASSDKPITPERIYPQQALQCYATSALESQKNGKIICPQNRNSHCIKEVINATSRADCGTIPGTHFGSDVWDIRLAQCVYRKCASECPTEVEDMARSFGGDEGNSSSPMLIGRTPTPIFNRTSYCCDTDLCNSGRWERHAVGFALLTFWAIFVYFASEAMGF